MELFEERNEVSYRSNCRTNLVIDLHELSLLLSNFTNKIDHHTGRYEPSSTSTKELHAQDLQLMARLLQCDQMLKLKVAQVFSNVAHLFKKQLFSRPKRHQTFGLLLQ